MKTHIMASSRITNMIYLICLSGLLISGAFGQDAETDTPAGTEIATSTSTLAPAASTSTVSPTSTIAPTPATESPTSSSTSTVSPADAPESPDATSTDTVPPSSTTGASVPESPTQSTSNTSDTGGDATSVAAAPIAPSQNGFDLGSFFGGFILCAALVAITYFGCKVFRTKKPDYSTL
ncbi:uncharacterized protein LOC120342902 [Styela clava]